MTGSARRPELRTLLTTLLPLSVFLLGLAVGALHHHGQEERGHKCLVCSLAHTPALAAAVVVAFSPAVRRERVLVRPPTDPATVRLSSPSGRSPPSL